MVPLILARFARLRRGLDCHLTPDGRQMAIQLARANSDGRRNERYSKLNLTEIDEKRQIHATYGWTRPAFVCNRARAYTPHPGASWILGYFRILPKSCIHGFGYFRIQLSAHTAVCVDSCEACILNTDTVCGYRRTPPVPSPGPRRPATGLTHTQQIILCEIMQQIICVAHFNQIHLNVNSEAFYDV